MPRGRRSHVAVRLYAPRHQNIVLILVLAVIERILPIQLHPGAGRPLNVLPFILPVPPLLFILVVVGEFVLLAGDVPLAAAVRGGVEDLGHSLGLLLLGFQGRALGN